MRILNSAGNDRPYRTYMPELIGIAVGATLFIACFMTVLALTQNSEQQGIQEKIGQTFQSLVGRADLGLDDFDWKTRPIEEVQTRLNNILRFQPDLVETWLKDANMGPIFNTHSWEDLIAGKPKDIDFVQTLTWNSIHTKSFGIFDWAISPDTNGLLFIRRPLSLRFEPNGFIFLVLNFKSMLAQAVGPEMHPFQLNHDGIICAMDREEVSEGVLPCHFTAADFFRIRVRQSGLASLWLAILGGLLGLLIGHIMRKFVVEPKKWLATLAEAAGSSQMSEVEEKILSDIQYRSPQYSHLISAIKKSQQIRFFSHIAHDLASPLTALSVLSSRLTSFPEMESKLLEHSIQRIDGICRNVLRKSQTKKRTTTSLEKLIEGIIRETSIVHAGHHLITLENGLEKDTKVCVDETDLERVISNLLTNAIQASGTESKIHVTLSDQDPCVVLKIQDWGAGMEAVVLAKLGTEQISSKSHKSERSGFGLGTLHAQDVIKKAGGEIFWDSCLGKGTAVTIQIPKETNA